MTFSPKKTKISNYFSIFTSAGFLNTFPDEIQTQFSRIIRQITYSKFTFLFQSHIFFVYILKLRAGTLSADAVAGPALRNQNKNKTHFWNFSWKKVLCEFWRRFFVNLKFNLGKSKTMKIRESKHFWQVFIQICKIRNFSVKWKQ